MVTLRKKIAISFGVCCVLSGCRLHQDKKFEPGRLPAGGPYSQLRASDAVPTANMPFYLEDASPMDLTEASLTPERLRPISLQECINLALQNSRVMRDLGVSVLRSPETVVTNFDPAIVYTDPLRGEEAALAAFDANIFASSFYEKNDRGFNNQFFGVGGLFQQDLSTNQFGVRKRSATGGQFTVRNVTVYDSNNQLSNRFGPSSWDSFLEAEARQPLLQGAGTQFNRIAGPGAAPGQLNGVLLARVRTDINLVDFERAVRDYLAEVENAYWDLYFSYRDLEARIQVRDIAIETLDKLPADDTSVGKIAQVREQIYRFQSDVIDALNGRAIDATRTNNGSTGGTFRSNGGVRFSERRLRLITGLPINDGGLLHPADGPTKVAYIFDWDSAIGEALTKREELRRQRWVIKQRELELLANRNFLRPQLDAVALYRQRGFDHTLAVPLSGDFQEWAVGVDFQMPAGFRRGYAAVRNSQLDLARASQLLREQERSVHYGLSNAVNESMRAFANLDLQQQRLDAIVTQLKEIEIKRDQAERAELDVRLETHRRLVDARVRYHQAEVEYVLSLRNVHLEKGTLLRYCNVFLNESAVPQQVLNDATLRVAAQDYAEQPDCRDIIVGRPAAQ